MAALPSLPVFAQPPYLTPIRPFRVRRQLLLNHPQVGSTLISILMPTVPRSVNGQLTLALNVSTLGQEPHSDLGAVSARLLSRRTLAIISVTELRPIKPIPSSQFVARILILENLRTLQKAAFLRPVESAFILTPSWRFEAAKSILQISRPTR